MSRGAASRSRRRARRRRARAGLGHDGQQKARRSAPSAPKPPTGPRRRERRATSRFLIPIDRATIAWRLPQCIIGVAMAGVAFALLVRSRLGLGPWEVLADGIHRQSGIPLGLSALLVGVVAMVVWIPLRQPIGLGTLVAVAVFGPVTDAVLPLVPEVPTLVERAGYLVAAVVLWGLGIAVYLSAGLGPGPRDGIMTAFVSRGYSVRTVRTIKELVVLLAGLAMGGAAGAGTLVYALAIGPTIHAWMVVVPRWVRPRPAPSGR